MRKVLALAVVALFAAATSAQATPISFDFSNAPTANVSFAGNGTTAGGGTFTFVDGAVSGFDFFVTGSSGFPDGSLLTGILGDGGNIGGVFTIGAISNPFGTLFTAPVTGTGTFSLFDGVNTLSSTLTWVDIFTFQGAGGLNAGGTINLSNLTYSGTNPDYLAWLSATGQHATLTFQFAAPTNLPTLSSTAVNTSYSGSASADITQVPEPATVSLLGMGLMGVAAAVRRRRAARK